MDIFYCEYLEVVENLGEELKLIENVLFEMMDFFYVIFEMFNVIWIVDEDIKLRKMILEVWKFFDDLIEYVKYIFLDWLNVEYFILISIRLVEGEGKFILIINDLLKKLEGIEKIIVE